MVRKSSEDWPASLSVLSKNHLLNVQPNPVLCFSIACSCASRAHAACYGERQQPEGQVVKHFFNLLLSRPSGHLWVSLDPCHRFCIYKSKERNGFELMGKCGIRCGVLYCLWDPLPPAWHHPTSVSPNSHQSPPTTSCSGFSAHLPDLVQHVRLFVFGLFLLVVPLHLAVMGHLWQFRAIYNRYSTAVTWG